MELTTAEDIHVVCLFERLEDAMAFGEDVDGRRMRIPNRVDIFGDQLILDEEDQPLGIEEDMSLRILLEDGSEERLATGEVSVRER